MTAEMRQSEFAALLGVSRAFVSQLKKSGRLVIKDGKVLVRESLELLRDTGSADKTGVSARHALERWKRGGHGVSVPDLAQAMTASPPPAIEPTKSGWVPPAHELAALPPASGNAIEAFNQARAINEIKRGELLELDVAERRRALISQEATVRTVTNLAAATRAAFERLPDRLATQLAAESDPRVVYAMLEQAIDTCCETLSHQVGDLINKL